MEAQLEIRKERPLYPFLFPLENIVLPLYRLRIYCWDLDPLR